MYRIDDAVHSELTEKIIGCAFDVQNELGSGFLESVYEKAMVVALSDAGSSGPLTGLQSM